MHLLAHTRALGYSDGVVHILTVGLKPRLARKLVMVLMEALARNRRVVFKQPLAHT